MPPKKNKQNEKPEEPVIQQPVIQQPPLPPPPQPKKVGKKAKKIVEYDSEHEEVEEVNNGNNDNINNNPDFKSQFETMLKINKPEDDLDCKVDIPDNYRCDFKKIKEGSLLYRPARIVVLDKNINTSNSKVRNQDLHKNGLEADWNLGHDLIYKQCWTPDQYRKVEKVSTSQLAHKLKEEVGDCICKVEFTKNPDISEMATLIRNGSQLIENSGVSEAEKIKMYKKLYERSQKGEYRIMRGYIVRGEDMQLEQTDIGMIKFLDADLLAKGEMAERLVNVKNIISLTFKLVKYQLK